MDIDTGNFHVFFPNGCYRKNPTQRTHEIIIALDRVIKSEGFDMVLFEKAKQAFHDSESPKRAQENLLKLSALVAPLFLLLLEQGFSRRELQHHEIQ